MADSASVKAETAILRRHERARSTQLVVGHISQPAKGFEGKANPLEVGIGRINELEPSEGMHLVARRQRETPAS